LYSAIRGYTADEAEAKKQRETGTHKLPASRRLGPATMRYAGRRQGEIGKDASGNKRTRSRYLNPEFPEDP